MYTELKPKEYALMKYIWSEQDGVTFGEIHDYQNSLEKAESRQYTQKYLKTLIDKGYISSEGEERRRIYHAVIKKEEYDNYMANKILTQLFDGSVKKFVSALSGNEQLTDQTSKELKQLLKRKGNGKGETQ